MKIKATPKIETLAQEFSVYVAELNEFIESGTVPRNHDRANYYLQTYNLTHELDIEGVRLALIETANGYEHLANLFQRAADVIERISAEARKAVKNDV